MKKLQKKKKKEITNFDPHYFSDQFRVFVKSTIAIKLRLEKQKCFCLSNGSLAFRLFIFYFNYSLSPPLLFFVAH